MPLGGLVYADLGGTPDEFGWLVEARVDSLGQDLLCGLAADGPGADDFRGVTPIRAEMRKYGV